MAPGIFNLPISKTQEILKSLQELESAEDPILTDYFYLTGMEGLIYPTSDKHLDLNKYGICLHFLPLKPEDPEESSFFELPIHKDSQNVLANQETLLTIIAEEIEHYFKPSTFEIRTHRAYSKLSISLFF